MQRHDRRARGANASVTTLESLETRRLLAFVVNTTLDETVANATTSLREAIALASANPGDDTITFDPAVFTEGELHTITPINTAYLINDVSGKMSIQGPGLNVLAISGANAGRSFNVSAGTVEMTGLTIRDGAGQLIGGGIYNEGTLTLDGVAMISNSVTGEAGLDTDNGENARGGAIFNEGTLTLKNGGFTSNSANGGAGGSAGGAGGIAFGGAIYSIGDVTISNVDFSGNSANGGAGGGSTGTGGSGGAALGGALYFDSDAAVTLSAVQLAGNSASGGMGATADDGGLAGAAQGGAIWTASTAFDGFDLTLSSNIALGGSGGGTSGGGAVGAGANASGGAIFNIGDMTLDTGLMNGNTAFAGSSLGGDAGAAFGGALFNGETALIDGFQFTSNATFGGAGGSGFGGGAQGGAIYTDDLLELSRSTLNFNIAKSGDAADVALAMGGALYITGATVNIKTTSITSNTATGGNGSEEDGGNAQGGGIRIQTGDVTITSSTLDHNTANGGKGADTVSVGGEGGDALGGAVSNSGNLKFANSTIYGNNVIGGQGGNAPSIAGDGGDSFGGGVYSNGASLSSINSTFASNEAQSALSGGAGGMAGQGRGGGFYSTGPANLVNTLVADNSATVSGSDLSGFFLANFSLITTSTDGSYALEAGSGDNLIGVPADLGPLQDNGGPTHTTMPAKDSDAVNAGDTAAATAEFGSLGDDQRGSGFPRILDDKVDIGAVEVGGAEIAVTGNGNSIHDGSNNASTTDNTDFGSAFQGSPDVQKTFVVHNDGNVALNIFDLFLPDGFVLVEALNGTIAAGGNDSFTIALDTNAVGLYFGDVEIVSSALSPAVFNFFVQGEVVNQPSASTGIHINFQPGGAPIPSGYVADAGSIFGARGNGLTYGWNASASSFTRDRDMISDQLKDTLVHMQLYGNRTWEISVPNGTYRVHLVAGDARYFDSKYRINIEGVLGVNGNPTSGNRFVEGTVTVKVSDGKLTISNASGAVNNKLNFIDITPVTAINFQTSGSATPVGYLADTGSVFGNRGNGNSYGWNTSASGFTRDRNSGLSPDQRYDTLVHTQIYGNRTWEFALANGQYEVRVVAGDPSYLDSHYKYNVEGILALDGTPTSGNRWIEGTVTVDVLDGRLTITNAPGSVNNKLAFVEITPILN